MQSIKKQKIENHLEALVQANHSLYELTADLSLLEAINEMTIKVSQALGGLKKQTEALNIEGSADLLIEPDAIDVLDEIVDTDAVSQIEERFFMAIDSMDDSVMGEFLAELIEKIELRYTCLVEAIHVLNELLNSEG